MSNINRIVFCLFFLLFAGVVFAESEGGALFRQNKPNDAIPILERDIAAGTAEAEDYNFLGLSYYQTGDWEKSVAAFEMGLAASGTNKRVLAFNAGNSCYGAGEFEKAEEYYSLAIIADSTFMEAVLNRANARFRQNKFSEAVEDYELFERNAPDDGNIPLVQEMILLLREEMRKREESDNIEAELARRRREQEARKNKEPLDKEEDPKDDETEDVQQGSYEIVEDDALPEMEDTATDDGVITDAENYSEMVTDDAIPETDEAVPENDVPSKDLQGMPQEIISEEIPEENLPEDGDSADAGSATGKDDADKAEIVPEKIDAEWLVLPDELPLPSSAAVGSDGSATDSVGAERFEMEMP